MTNRIECPSLSWDRHCEAEERATACDEGFLGLLDAYGHMVYTVGIGEEGDDDGDWLACLDFCADVTPDDELRVAYHVVVNSESGCFIETVQEGIVSGEGTIRAYLLDLPLHYFSIAREAMERVPTRSESQDAVDCNSRWNTAILRTIEEIA